MHRLFFADRILESSLSVGTGPLQLADVVPGFRSFAEAVTPDVTFAYVITGEGAAPQWEVGIGHLVPQGEGFAVERLADISSDGAGACDFIAGQKTIALTASARWFSEAQEPPIVNEPTAPILHVPQFENGWGNFAPWAAPVQYYQGADGRVYLSGNIGGGAGGNNIILFTLPNDMGPSATEFFTVRNSGSTDVVGIYIRSNGDVVLQSGSPAWFSLSGISFLADS